MNNNLIENRQIRVFISSTFQDMQDERDELMKKTFPVLRQKAAERDVTLTELDLRWGITPEESESGKVVEICLREIENSVPFFVGIIGNRYGWIPSAGDLGEGLAERFSQVKGYVDRHLSVTEMEMQFGVLERKENMHAFFYIKEQEGVSVDEPEKLAELKEKVRNNGRYPVSTYSSIEDLAVQVENAFTKLLDDLYPEGALSELEKERIGQRAYLNRLCQNYIRTESNFAAIEEWVSDWEKHQLVITGASGLGKSALVANWIKEKLVSGEELPYRIIYHFVGNGGSLGSHGHVIKALCDEIRDRYGFDTEDKEAKTDEKALEELFNLVAAEGDKPLVIVLDAVNQIIDTEHSKRLNWLPIPPKKVKILFTTLENDETMEVFKDRHYPVFTLHPLTKKQRREMVRQYLSLYSKKLQEGQVDRIVDDKQCKNTLVLKTLLDELVNFGIYEKLDEKIGIYLGASSVEAFYDILLKGYEEDFGEQFVKHILSLIAVSRNGLSEEEILAITHETPLHWSQFFCAIRQHLVVKNGLVSFAHSYIRLAVDARYVQNQVNWKKTCQEEIISFFDKVKTHRAMDEIPYQLDIIGDTVRLHEYLVDLDVFEYLQEKERHILGKYWRELISSGQYSLAEYLPIVENVDEARKAEIYATLSSFTRTTVVDSHLSKVFIEKALPFAKDDEERANVLTYLGFASRLSADYNKALDYQIKSLDIRKALFGETHHSVASSYNNIGRIYIHLGDYEKALDYLEQALKIRLSLFGENHQAVAQSYSNIGMTYYHLEDIDNATKYQERALKIRLSLFGRNSPTTANSFNDLGILYSDSGDTRKALDYQEKALMIRLSLFGETNPVVATFYNNLGCTYENLGDHKKALEYQEKALKIRLSLFGENHSDVANSYRNIGYIYGELGDNQRALVYFEKALGLMLPKFGETHPEVASLFSSLGFLYRACEEHQKSLEYYEKELRSRLYKYGENHPDVASSYESIGESYSALKDYQKALENHEKALGIRLSLFGENNLDVASSFDNAGYALLELDEYKKALTCLSRALKIHLFNDGSDNYDVLLLYYRMGAAEKRLGHVEKEIELRTKALEVALRLEDDDLAASLFGVLGKAYRSSGQSEKANDYFRLAAEKYRELGDEVQAQENLAMIEE